MTCKRVALLGGFAVVCTRGGRPAPPCAIPGCGRPHAKLCDWPVYRRGKPGTCDIKVCEAHAHHSEPDRDLCPAHARIEASL